MQIGPAPLLIVRRQDSSPSQIEWVKPILTIGRESANDLVIDHPLASRRHARLEHDESGYFVRDLESTNGTYVNGERVARAVLKDGDRLRVGAVELMVVRTGGVTAES